MSLWILGYNKPAASVLGPLSGITHWGVSQMPGGVSRVIRGLYGITWSVFSSESEESLKEDSPFLQNTDAAWLQPRKKPWVRTIQVAPPSFPT